MTKPTGRPRGRPPKHPAHPAQIARPPKSFDPKGGPRKGAFAVVCQLWEIPTNDGKEPDGFSLHLTVAHRIRFIDSYMSDLSDSDPVPVGNPFEVYVSMVILDKVKGSGDGYRDYGTHP